MPDRYVRHALLRSHAWTSLTNELTQLLFIRLILIVDDFGCFDGREEVIANEAYPQICFNPEELQELHNMMHELHSAGMIIRYTNGGKPFIAITQWGNGLRGARRFPAPPLDIDVEGLKHRGKFGKDIGWTNPPGADVVSILLDPDLRVAVPQPPEWRPPEHLRPNPKAKVGWRYQPSAPVTGSVEDQPQLQAASNTQPVTAEASSSNTLPDTGSRFSILHTPIAVAVDAERHQAMSPVTGSGENSPTTPANGNLIKFQNGGFVGLTEEQRVKWQLMFDELRIPDQVDRAAAWLDVHPDERGAIERQGLGFGQFLVRWLLREARSPRTGQAS